MTWAAIGAVVTVLAASSCSSAAPAADRENGSGSSTTTAVPNSATSTTATTAPLTNPRTGTPIVTTAPPTPLIVGQWHPVGEVLNGQPAITATLFQSRPGSLLTAVARINAAVTRPVLFAGTTEPVGTWPHKGFITASERAGLVAAFNSGFKLASSAGGWYDDGRAAVALRDGAASLVIHADGSATVGMWGRDATLTPDVVSVRQNLVLLVDGGVDRSAGLTWGAVLGGGTYTWRSGLGVDGAGNLLYAGGADLDARSLAAVLIAAGAVRAMELDINPSWVAFTYYNNATTGADLLASMNFGPTHWLLGSARDFIAIFAR